MRKEKEKNSGKGTARFREWETVFWHSTIFKKKKKKNCATYAESFDGRDQLQISHFCPALKIPEFFSHSDTAFNQGLE